MVLYSIHSHFVISGISSSVFIFGESDFALGIFNVHIHDLQSIDVNIKAAFINLFDGFVLVYIQCRITHPINNVGSLKDGSVC